MIEQVKEKMVYKDADWPSGAGAAAAAEFRSSVALLARSDPAARPLYTAVLPAGDSHSSAAAGGPEAQFRQVYTGETQAGCHAYV